MIAKFGSLRRVLAATDRAREAAIPGHAAAFIGIVNRALAEMLKAEAESAPVFPTTSAVVDYLRFSMGGLSREQVRALFLDSKNALIAEDVVAEGSLREAPIYPREIARRGLDIGAAGLILVHNHPSGDAQPSAEDVRATRDLATACKAVDILLVDHIVIASGGISSFYAEGRL